jgi:hypothetical protein
MTSRMPLPWSVSGLAKCLRQALRSPMPSHLQSGPVPSELVEGLRSSTQSLKLRVLAIALGVLTAEDGASHLLHHRHRPGAQV